MTDDQAQFEQTMRAMGFSAGGSNSDVLPDLPPSDPASLKENRYDGFYKRGAREFWSEAQITSQKIAEPKKCMHYLQKKQNEVICTLCHVGWVVPESFHTVDGKLYDQETPLVFAYS